MRVAVLGPHGSGNRLMTRLLRAGGLNVRMRSYPADGWPGGWGVSDTTSMTSVPRPDVFFVMMREVAPWSQVRESRPGAETLHGALLNWEQAYREIGITIGPGFWWREDVAMVRYRDFVDQGAQFMAERVAAFLGMSSWEFNEAVNDGDLKYRRTPEAEYILGRDPWSTTQLVLQIATIDHLRFKE